MFAEVIIDIAHSDVDKVFDYKLNNNIISVGSRVSVPFGNRTIDGIVIKIKNETLINENKIKEILCVKDDLPAVNAECLKLAAFMRDKYHIPFALALRQFIPSEMRNGRIKPKIIKFAQLCENKTPVEMKAELRKGSTARKKL